MAWKRGIIFLTYICNIYLIVHWVIVHVNIQEMDAMMYIWREKTSLRRWNIDRVAFMNAMFCLQIEKEYKKCKDDKRGYVVPDLLFSYGRGELPSHGRTNRVWGVDVDRLYFPLFVNGNYPCFLSTSPLFKYFF